MHYNKRVRRPRGIFPSLPGGMDLVIKDYFDKYRSELPPELVGKVEGTLMPNLNLMQEWRNWRTGLEYHDKKLDAVLFGALDDCLLDEVAYIPIDYKTRGSAPGEADSKKYYRTQLETYNLLLSANGYKIKDFAYLVYYYPKEVRRGGLIEFDIKIVKIETDIERTRKIFSSAVELLRGPMPSDAGSCEHCLWLKKRGSWEPKKLPTDLFE